MGGDTSYNVPFWKTSVIYQAYPRSISDQLPDGTGDLVGKLLDSILFIILVFCVNLSVSVSSLNTVHNCALFSLSLFIC